MSKEFTQFRVDDDTKEDWELKSNIALGIPNLEETPYPKGIIECCINLLKDCAHGPNIRDAKKLKTDEELLILIRKTSQLLQYISNCNSWNNEELKEFDKDEINKRIEMLKLR